MATFAVEVWSWKLCQIEDPLVFDAPIRGSVMVLLIKTSHCRAGQNIELNATLFWRALQYDVLIHGTADCGAKANGSLIWHNFQDQTSTAKVDTPPKSMYKGWSNGLCQVSGNFYEARTAKFWYVNSNLEKPVWESSNQETFKTMFLSMFTEKYLPKCEDTILILYIKISILDNT